MNVTPPRTRFRSRAAVQADIDKYLVKLRELATTGLHLGAADTRIDGLTNCDLYNEAADLKLDSSDLSRFGDGEVDHIETHHMIEHLSFEQAKRALKEWGRVLRAGGHLVITCPDLTVIARQWLLHGWVHRLRRSRGYERDYALQTLMGSQEHEGMFHRSNYDRMLLEEMLGGEGLSVIFSYSPYPRRQTPSLLVVARKG